MLEPFIVPGVFEPYENDTEPAVDEYTLMQKWGDQAVARLTEHYETFIVRRAPYHPVPHITHMLSLPFLRPSKTLQRWLEPVSPGSDWSPRTG